MAGYCYRFLDCNNNVLYIGKAKNLTRRLFQHKREGHLTEEQYNKVNKVQYIKFPTYNDAGLCERYFISKYKPPFNISMTNEGEITLLLDLSGYKWEDCNIDVKSIKKSPIRNKNKMNFDRILKNVCMIDTTGSTFILHRLKGKPVEYYYCTKEVYDNNIRGTDDYSAWMPEQFVDEFLECVNQYGIPIVYGDELSHKNGIRKKLDEMFREVDIENEKEMTAFHKKAKELWAENRFVNMNILLNHPELDYEYDNQEYRVEVRKMVQDYIASQENMRYIK